MDFDIKRLTGFEEDRQKYLIKIFNVTNVPMKLYSRDQEEGWLIESGRVGEHIPEQLLLVLSLKGRRVHERGGQCQAKGLQVGSLQEMMKDKTRKWVRDQIKKGLIQ